MNTNESIIDRIKRMELYFDTIRNALRSGKDISENPEISTMLDALTSYYESKQWLADYEADERGEIPHDLKRGVLSEDGIYNLLSELKTLTEKSEQYFSEFCDVSYNSDNNVVFVKWKKFCCLEDYRKPLEFALEIIKKYRCDYVADTRNGFENIPEDNKWVADYFMPTAAEYGCRCIYFIIDEDNSLKDELEGQENDSKSIIQFKYITMESITDS